MNSNTSNFSKYEDKARLSSTSFELHIYILKNIHGILHEIKLICLPCHTIQQYSITIRVTPLGSKAKDNSFSCQFLSLAFIVTVQAKTNTNSFIQSGKFSNFNQLRPQLIKLLNLYSRQSDLEFLENCLEVLGNKYFCNICGSKNTKKN